MPGNLIYANGHRFVARRFRHDLHGAPGAGSRTGGDRADMPYYEVSVQRQAVRETRPGETSSLSGTSLRTMAVCDTDLIHTSHISDEEDLRFQLGVAIYGTELGQHSGGRAFRWGPATRAASPGRPPAPRQRGSGRCRRETGWGREAPREALRRAGMQTGTPGKRTGAASLATPSARSAARACRRFPPTASARTSARRTRTAAGARRRASGFTPT